MGMVTMVFVYFQAFFGCFGHSLGHQGVFDLWPCYSMQHGFSCAGLAVSDGFCGVSINCLFIPCLVL